MSEKNLGYAIIITGVVLIGAFCLIYINETSSIGGNFLSQSFSLEHYYKDISVSTSVDWQKTMTIFPFQSYGW